MKKRKHSRSFDDTIQEWYKLKQSRYLWNNISKRFEQVTPNPSIYDWDTVQRVRFKSKALWRHSYSTKRNANHRGYNVGDKRAVIANREEGQAQREHALAYINKTLAETPWTCEGIAYTEPKSEGMMYFDATMRYIE